MRADPPATAQELAPVPRPSASAPSAPALPRANPSTETADATFPSPRTEAELAETAAVLALPGSRSTSIGGPNDGSVEGSVALPMRGPGFRFGPARDPAARHGTVEMVQSLVRAAAYVDARLPGSELTINDLGLVRGGAIPHHASHRSGRDVDVLFYVLDEEGRPRAGIGAPIEPDGSGTDYRDLAVAEDDRPIRIDVPRSWAFVEAVLGGAPVEGAVVQRIFVVEHVRTMLLAHARSVGAQAELVRRFEEVTCQPSYPHDDHFHLRYFCTAEDLRAGCTESAPLYPWHLQAMRAEGVRPSLQVVRPDRPRATIVTEAEARAGAGEMHADVVAFLARRDAWAQQPHPGRRYCR